MLFVRPQTVLASVLATTAILPTSVLAQVYKGFNYGSTYTDGVTPILGVDYVAQFNAAKSLVGTSGFTSARLYTCIQAGTAGAANAPSEAFQAAIDTKTSLLIGLWASAGDAGISDELAALTAALAAHGSALADLIVAISVGSEDLYRISPTGIINKSGIGAGPEAIAAYISRVKAAIADTAAQGKLVGHVDTWTAWVNGSNAAVITASDFIGVDAYPYFQNTMTNDITDGYALFFDAYDQTVAVAGGKPVWVTETGWPVSGATQNLAVPSTANAKIYWDQVGCGRLFDHVNTWWYTLQDAFPTTPNPSFGLVAAGVSGADVPTTPLYDLSCTGSSTSVPASQVTIVPTTAAPAASAQAGGNNGAQRQNQAEQSGAAAPAASGTVENSEAGPNVGAVGGSGAHTETTFATLVKTITSCPAGCPTLAEVPSIPITHTTALPAAAANAANGCPAQLTGQYEYPHLIVPVNKDSPATAYGTSYNGTVSASISSIFNFDIPAADAGKTCSLVFLLPTQSELTTSAFTLSGSGGLEVAALESPATEQTTYETVPASKNSLGGPASVFAGTEYVVSSGACPAGSRIGYKVSATGSLALDFFQDYNPSPIGFYITVC